MKTDIGTLSRLNISCNGIISFAVIALIILMATGRATGIYIEHDDWDFLVSPEYSLFASPWSKTLSEGRWINFIWSQFSINLSTCNSFYIFIIGYALFCWFFSCNLSNSPCKRIVFAVTAFICPVYSSFSTWPTTSAPSVWIAALSMFFCCILKDRFWILSFITAYLLSLSYPPLGLVCVAIIAYRSNSFRNSIATCMAYFIGFLAGILSIYIANKVFHGVFGLVPEAWRNFHPIKNISDIPENFLRAIHSFIYFVTVSYMEIIISAVALLSIYIRERKIALVLVISIAFVFLLDFSLLFYSGIDVSARIFIWPWHVMLLCIAISSRYFYLKNISIIYCAALIFCFITGLKTWATEGAYYSRLAEYMNAVDRSINSQNTNEIYLCGSPKFVDVRTIQMMIRKNNNMDTIRGSMEECEKIKDYGVSFSSGKTYYKFM